MAKLRILVVSNFYPPFHIGGYELGCRDVITQLTSRGHTVGVLTSTWGAGRRSSGDGVYRLLQSDLGWNDRSRLVRFGRLAQKEITNRRAFSQVLREFKPQIVYFWNLASLSISLVFDAQALGLPCCYFVSDNWLANWESDAWHNLWRNRSRSIARRWGKALLVPALRIGGVVPSGDLELQHVQFTSLYLKRVAMAAGKQVSDAELIPCCIEIARFPYQPLRRQPTRILYAGQLAPHKGVRTAIEAIDFVVNGKGRRDVRLTIVGGGIRPGYVTQLVNLVSSYGLRQHVEFSGPVPRDQMPSMYQAHDILVFPSTWDEPFSLVLLEGLSSGLAVVATPTGGSAEILEDGFNSLVFPREDGQACAEGILRLLDDPELFETLRRNGRRAVEVKYDLQREVDAIENSLQRIAAGKETGRPAT